jgi:flagellar basal body P-ring formation protein FlgA
MWRFIFLFLPEIASADSLVATRTIRAQSVVQADDITLVDAAIPGAITGVEGALGLEARVTIYAGRPIKATDLGPPTLIDRNQIVSLEFQSGGLAILAEGRALARGGVGDVIRVMNLASRNTVSGRVAPDGTVHVGTNQ